MKNTRAEKVAEYLKLHSRKLKNMFKWDSNIESLEKVFGELPKEYSKNKEAFLHYFDLKKFLEEKLKNIDLESDDFKKIYKWIIKDWGRIKIGNEDNLHGLVKDFINRKDDKPRFDRLASTSKVGAFMFPEDCIIYDSRVSYSLNWILLSKGETNNFFPIPEGRNSKMNAFDIDVLIRLINKEKYLNNYQNDKKNKNHISETDKVLFYDKNNAYCELNRLVKEVNVLLWDSEEDKHKPYLTEMLLFSIADTVVYKDILERVGVVLNEKSDSK